MALVQGSHGRDKTDLFPIGFLLFQEFREAGPCVEYFQKMQDKLLLSKNAEIYKKTKAVCLNR
jgi:hypothetical protein